MPVIIKKSKFTLKFKSVMKSKYILKFKWIILVTLITAFLLSVSGCGAAPGPEGSTQAEDNSREYRMTDFVMDTVLSETIYSDKDYSKEIKDNLDSLEKSELSWRESGSEIAKINEALQTGETFTISQKMISWITMSMSLAYSSEGCFDPTIGALTSLWNIEGDDPSVPNHTDIIDALGSCGYEALHYKGDQISSVHPLSLDLGAVGKGIALDEIQDYLMSRPDIKGATVSVGGSVIVYRNKPDGEPWNVGITDPQSKDGSPIGVLHLNGTHCISTSGDYEKYFIEDGIKYHHILDGTTGYPADSDLASVTIVCDDGLLSDGLSTACYILGIEESLPLLKQYHAEAVFIDHDNKITVTEGLKGDAESGEGNRFEEL